MTYETGKYCEKKFFIVQTSEMSILFQFSLAGVLRIILKKYVSGGIWPPPPKKDGDWNDAFFFSLSKFC